MIKLFFISIFVTLSLIGCQDSNQHTLSPENEEVTNMVDEQLYDINYLFDAPIAKEKHDVSTVIKVVWTEGSGSNEHTIAIDIQNKKIYLEPHVSTNGIVAQTGSVPVSDAEKVIDLLKKHSVQDWVTDDPMEVPDPAKNESGWSLWLQFEDGTVEKQGEAEITNETTPTTYHAFVKDLQDFVDARVITLDPKPK